MKSERRLYIYAAFICVAVLLDQLTKSLARTNLSTSDMTFIPGVLDLHLVMNSGAAFSIGSNSTWVFIVLSVVIVAAATIWVIKEGAMPLALAASLGAVSGGGIGNLIDRVVAGEVTDFFATTFIDFPVFNVADIFVTLGVIAAFIIMFRWDPDAHVEERKDSEAL